MCVCVCVHMLQGTWPDADGSSEHDSSISEESELDLESCDELRLQELKDTVSYPRVMYTLTSPMGHLGTLVYGSLNAMVMAHQSLWCLRTICSYIHFLTNLPR